MCILRDPAIAVKRRKIMYKSKSEAIVEDDGKLFIYVETNEEGIADFKRSSKYEGLNVELSSMIVEGKTVPAFKFEVTDRNMYQDYKREQWRQEDAWKQDQRCIICGENGKSKRCPLRVKNPNFSGKEGEKKTVAVDCTMCPFNRQFRPVKGMVSFSSLELRDKDGNVGPYEPEGGRYSVADDYLRMLHDFIEYVRAKYPKYAHYTELIEILGEEVKMKEAAAGMKKSDKTLYGWLKRLRPIFDEFKGTVDYM